MSGSARKLLLIVRFSLLRILRQPASTIVMVGIPLAIIPILGSVLSKVGSFGSFLDGAPDTTAFFAVGMVVLFQLFSGRFAMEGTKDSLISERKWRIYSAPCAPGVHAMGILLASTVVSVF